MLVHKHRLAAERRAMKKGTSSHEGMEWGCLVQVKEGFHEERPLNCDVKECRS